MASESFAMISPPPARLRVTVLPLFPTTYDSKQLGDAIVLEVDATASILELKDQIRGRLRDTHNAFVPSIFRLQQPLEEILSSFSSSSNTSGGDTDDPSLTHGTAISELVMRRENYLLSASTIGSYHLESSADLCVVALVIARQRDPFGLFGWSQVFEADAVCLETLVFSDITSSTTSDGTLPPSPSRRDTRIFVRDVYSHLYQRICAWFKLMDDFEPAPKRCKTTVDCYDSCKQHGDTVVVTATPGTGKTALLWFLVHQFSALATHDVVVQCLDLFLLVRPDGTMIRGTEATSFDQELDRRETIYLVEVKDDVSHLCIVPWRAKMVVVTAPNPKLVASIRGQRVAVETLFMPTWTLAELEQCRRTCYADRSIDKDYVATLFAHYGGAVQSIFLLEDPVEKRIESLQATINRLSEDDVHVILFMPMWTLAELEACRRACYADRSMEEDYVATLFAHYGALAYPVANTGDTATRIRGGGGGCT